MPTLLLRFPGGRYHATPYGHHVNEGLVEWPPSPWRLLRALIACGYATQGWDEVPPAGRELIEALAKASPCYHLPPASLAHSRHFMPTAVLDKGREKTTLVFDAWAEVGEGVLAVRWDCALGTDAASLLKTLAGSLGYLGRSESWVLAEVEPDDVLPPGAFNARPHVDGNRPGRDWEQISLIAPSESDSYTKWRLQAVEKALAPYPLSEGRAKTSAKVLKARATAESPFPVDLMDCLQTDTAWWKGHRWSQPPGSQRVLYWRQSDSMSVVMPHRTRVSLPPPIEMMLLALTTPSGSRSALPSLARTLPQAELLHRSLISRVGRGGSRLDCPELTGRDADGKPLTGHQHAHLLPVDLDDDGHLDHIIVYSPMGLGPEAQSAIRTLRRTWTKGGVGDLQLALAGQGSLDDLRSLPEPLRRGVELLLGPVSGASVWRSTTPIVLPRYPKRNGTNTLPGQILAELESRGFPSARVEVLPWDEKTLRLRHTVRVRRSPAKPPPVDAGHPIRLIFDEPVKGPIALGYASHFGLGTFGAE